MPESGDGDEECTLWIGNLCSWGDISFDKIFADNYDEISSMKVIVSKKTGSLKGYGFLKFLTRSGAERFLKKYNGTPMPSSKQEFTLNWASAQAVEEARKTQLKQWAANAPTFKIYVGNLSDDVTRDLLLETFRALYISVKGGNIAIDTISGQCKGYGFVMFIDESEQTRAITEMNGVPCSSRPMRIGYTFQSVRRRSNLQTKTLKQSVRHDIGSQEKRNSVAGKAIKKKRESVSEKKEDEPIYILCSSYRFPYEQFYTFCYLIEDNRNIEQGTTPTPVINNKLINKGKCQLLRSNGIETDRIQSLSLPSLSAIDTTHLLVFNSCLFLLGGTHHHRKLEPPPHSVVRFCDLNSHLKNDWVWQIGPCSNSPGTFVQAAASNNGSIVIMGADTQFSHYRPLWLRSLSSGWENLPKLPRKLHLSFKTARLLAVTDTRILWVMDFKTSRRTCGVCFDLEEWKWRVFDKNSFDGFWSEGVVLFESYLFLYGVDNKTKILSLYVYDLEQCHFLPDIFFTGNNQYEKAFPPTPLYNNNLLFKVNHNKLAIVWWEPSQNRGVYFTDVHCTKFVICRVSTSSTDETHKPVFHADVVSHQTYCIEGNVIDCTARVTMREQDEERLERGRAEDQCHKIIEQDEESSDGDTESISSDWEIGCEDSISEVSDAELGDGEEESVDIFNRWVNSYRERDQRCGYGVGTMSTVEEAEKTMGIFKCYDVEWVNIATSEQNEYESVTMRAEDDGRLEKGRAEEQCQKIIEQDSLVHRVKKKRKKIEEHMEDVDAKGREGFP